MIQKITIDWRQSEEHRILMAKNECRYLQEYPEYFSYTLPVGVIQSFNFLQFAIHLFSFSHLRNIDDA